MKTYRFYSLSLFLKPYGFLITLLRFFAFAQNDINFVGSIHESTAINETIKIKSGDHRSPLQIYSHFIFFELSFQFVERIEFHFFTLIFLQAHLYKLTIEVTVVADDMRFASLLIILK